MKLTKANALNYFSSVDDYERYWLSGKRLFTAGIVVSSVGAGIVLGSAVGGTLVLVSVPLYWVGTVKLKKAAGAGSTGSVAYTPELSFVTQSGGIGLALNF